MEALEIYYEGAQGDMVNEYEADVLAAVQTFVNDIENEKQVEKIKKLQVL